MSRYIWPILTPSLCHTLSHIPGPPRKYVTHFGPPSRFLVGLVQKPGQKPPVQILSIVHGPFCPGGLSWGLLSGKFCPGWFLSVPPSVRIHLLQQKVKHHFNFHMCDKKIYKRDVTCSL